MTKRYFTIQVEMDLPDDAEVFTPAYVEKLRREIETTSYQFWNRKTMLDGGPMVPHKCEIVLKGLTEDEFTESKKAL